MDRTAIASLKKMEETKRNIYNIKGGTMICKYILFMKFINVEGCNKRGGWNNFKRKKTWRGDCKCGGVTNSSKRINVDPRLLDRREYKNKLHIQWDFQSAWGNRTTIAVP